MTDDYVLSSSSVNARKRFESFNACVRMNPKVEALSVVVGRSIIALRILRLL